MKPLSSYASLLLAIVVGCGSLASVRTASAGAASAAQGCMQQWMFNGVWRVKVTDVEPDMNGDQQVGWAVTEVWRNGSDQTTSPSATFAKAQMLTLANGTVVSVSDSSRGLGSAATLGSHDFPPSAQFTYVQEFAMASNLVSTDKPKSVTIGFDASRIAQITHLPQFTTSHYDYDISFGCTATGAVANAAGGSKEVPAKDGCMHQWMSNGLWRMRIVSMAPDSPSGQQIGWAITEDWTNVSHKTTNPSATAVGDQQLILATADTISSTNSAGSQMVQGQLINRDFAPGSSFTYTQLFRPDIFNANDTPEKLLVTFDAKMLATRTLLPQYTVNPPNFRISLTCDK